MKSLKETTAQDLIQLQIIQLQQLRNGSMTIDQLSWFNKKSYEEREELMNTFPVKDDSKERKSLRAEIGSGYGI